MDIINEQESKSKSQEGLTLDHIHKQLRQMNHPDCPAKAGSQAKLQKLLSEMPRLRCCDYQTSFAFYVHLEEILVSDEMLECDSLGDVNDKLVKIPHKVEEWIGPHRPWEVQPIKASELIMMREDVQDALSFLEAEDT